MYGKYRLEERISSSLVAEVFRAKSHGVEGFEKTVVIKRLRAQMVHVRGYIQAFIDEAKAGVRLSHANLVQVFDLGQVDQTVYQAKEHVAGPDLGLVMAQARSLGTRLPLDLAIHLVCELVKGLDYTHRRKDYQLRPLHLVHAGVHPWNVLISLDGETKLTNFGALRLHGLLPEPARPPVASLLPYLAPEVRGGQAWGQPADLYSAAAILLELLTDELPGPAGGVGDSLAQRSGLPPELPGLIQRALDPDPAQRFARTGDLYEALVAMLFRAGMRPSNRALGAEVRRLVEEHPLPAARLLDQRQRRPETGQASAVPHRPLPPSRPPPPTPVGGVSQMQLSAVGRSPRRAAVVTADPSRALPALTDEALEAASTVRNPEGSPAAAAAVPPPRRHTPAPRFPPRPLPGDERGELDTRPLRRGREAAPFDPLEQTDPTPEGPLPSTPRPVSAAPASAAPLPPARPPMEAAPSGAATPRPTPRAATTPAPSRHSLPAGAQPGPGPAPGATLPVTSPSGADAEGPTLREPERTGMAWEAAVLHLRCGVALSGQLATQVQRAVAQLGGRPLTAAAAETTVAFPAGDQPARALQRALSCALQLVALGGDQPLCAAGVHGGTLQLERTAGRTRAQAGDLVTRRAVELAGAASAGEVLCSEVGPLLVSDGFAFSAALGPGGEAGAHRVLPSRVVHTQRGSWVGERRGSEPSLAPVPGRDAELAEFDLRVRAMMRRRGSVVAMRGAPGVGKTALVETLRERLRGDHVAWFHVRLFGGVEQMPFGGLRALLSALCAVEEEQGDAELGQQLERLVQLGLSQQELSGVRSVFALRRHGSSRRRVSPGARQLLTSASHALLAGTLRKVFTQLVSEKPVVLVIDDVQHLDPETWELLRELMTVLPETPALLILTSRHPIPLPDGPGLFRMALRPPEAAAIRARVGALAEAYQAAAGGAEATQRPAAEALVDAIVAAAEGNPRRAEDLVRLLSETGRLHTWTPGGPLVGTAPELASQRVAALPAGERALLQAAASIGQLFGVDLLARVAEEPEPAVRQQLRRLARRGLVESIGRERYAFRDELVATVLCRSVPERLGRELHARIAAQIEVAHHEDRERFLEELAFHHGRAGNSRSALRYLEALADRLEASNHPRAAIARLEAAVALLDEDPAAKPKHRIAVLLRIGELSIPAMELELGRQALDQALKLAQQGHHEREVVRCLLLLGRSWLAAGVFDEALAHLKRALRLASTRREPGLVVGIYAAIGEAYQKNEDLSRSVDYLRRALARAQEPVQELRLLSLLASSYAGLGDIEASDRMLARATERAGASPEPQLRCVVLKTRSLLLFFRGEMPGCLRACLEGAEIAQAVGAPAEEMVFLHNAGDCCLRLGDLARAHHLLSRSQELARAHGLARNHLTNEILLAYLDGLQGGAAGHGERTEAAAERLRLASERAEELNLSWERIQAHLYLGKLEAQRGRTLEAHSQLGLAAGEARRIHLRFLAEEAERELALLQ